MADTTMGTGRTAAGSPPRALEQAKDIGNELLGAVRDSANSLYEEQRDRAANEISSFGEVLRRSASSADPMRDTIIARYADDAARQITGFADTLRHRSLDELSADIEDFARRWPLLFMTAAVGVGIIAGRFMVASASRPHPSTQPQVRAQTAPTWESGFEEPAGGARHDYGAVEGGVSGGARAGYGAGSGREIG